MAVLGWIFLAFFTLLGLFVIGLLVSPYIISEVKVFSYKIKKAVEDKRDDVDKRSEERKKRDELRRQKDFELANKKLDTKLQKVDKQIDLYKKKLSLSQELKQTTEIEKQGLLTKEPVNQEITKKEVKKEQVKPKKVEEIIKEEIITDEDDGNTEVETTEEPKLVIETENTEEKLVTEEEKLVTEENKTKGRIE